MAKYKVEFGLCRGDGSPIPRKVLEGLTDTWVASVEDHDLYSGGGIREYTRLDALLDWIWIQLWRIKWLRCIV